jgi:molecular chaperone Hsp33
MDSSDTVLRAITDDGSFRVIALETTSTVRDALAAQKPASQLRRTFADFLTGAILVRESMSPELRVQCILQGDDGRSRLVADAHPDGTTRGLVQLAQGAQGFSVNEKGVMQVARTLNNGALHQGVVSVAGHGGIAGAFMAYMQDSEQITTMIAVGTHMVDGEVAAAGGYLVQILPDFAEGPLMVMTERLKDFQDIVPLLARGAASPEALLAETLYGMEYTRVGERRIAFGCNCSSTRLAASLATLPKADIESLLADRRMLEIECEFCRKEYSFAPEQLRGLLDPN